MIHDYVCVIKCSSFYNYYTQQEQSETACLCQEKSGLGPEFVSESALIPKFNENFFVQGYIMI